MWRPISRTPEGFETFYQESRDRLLLQCYALTGDLPASQRAVRDAMVVAWHHWRKVARLERPEDWVRPVAWNRALRLRQVRRWSRQKGLEPEVRATLDALGRLTTTRRRVLLLTALTASPLESIAREAGVTRASAERELQTATAELAVHRGVPSTSVRALLEQVAGDLGEVRWPRPSIVMRAGSRRRRVHTLAGAAAVVATLAVAGTLVSESGDAHPALATKGLTHGETPAASGRSTASSSPTREPDPLTAAALVGTDQVAAALPGQWTQGDTSANTSGDGLTFTCQSARYGDPQGLGALVRTFTGTGPRGGALTAGQAAEASADDGVATQDYATTLDWYAGCTSPRVQLVGTYAVSGVGDQATLLVLRSWQDPQTTQVVGVARTGRLTTTTVTTQPDRDGTPASVDLDRRAGLLGAAVTGLCALPGHGACTTTPSARPAPALPVGKQPGLVSEVDLPPVASVTAPWVGSDPVPATQNAAATRCDDASFAAFPGAVTRTFVIPDAQQLSAEFGLTETAGVADGKAKDFVATVRQKLGGCHDRDLGTDVSEVTRSSTSTTDLDVWRLDVKVSKTKTVHFLMAVLRDQGTVAQLTFVPSGDATMSGTDFVALAKRAQERLAYLTG